MKMQFVESKEVKFGVILQKRKIKKLLIEQLIGKMFKELLPTYTQTGSA
jgi:hypothetical protein